MNQREKFAYLFFYRIRYLLNNYALEVKPVINYHLNNNCVLWKWVYETKIPEHQQLFATVRWSFFLNNISLASG